MSPLGGRQKSKMYMTKYQGRPSTSWFGSRWRSEMGKILRFAIMGGIGAVLYIAITIALTSWGVRQVIASLVAQILTGVLFYLGHGLVTFGVDPSRPKTVMRFLIFAVGSLSANAALTAFLLHVAHMPSMVVVGILTIMVPVVNYFISRFWVFA